MSSIIPSATEPNNTPSHSCTCKTFVFFPISLPSHLLSRPTAVSCESQLNRLPVSLGLLAAKTSADVFRASVVQQQREMRRDEMDNGKRRRRRTTVWLTHYVCGARKGRSREDGRSAADAPARSPSSVMVSRGRRCQLYWTEKSCSVAAEFRTKEAFVETWPLNFVKAS